MRAILVHGQSKRHRIIFPGQPVRTKEKSEDLCPPHLYGKEGANMITLKRSVHSMFICLLTAGVLGISSGKAHAQGHGGGGGHFAGSFAGHGYGGYGYGGHGYGYGGYGGYGRGWGRG